MELNSGPCGAWIAADCVEWPESTDPVRDIALMAATEILWNRTKRRFGLCELTLRPCRQECWPDGFANWMYGSWLPTYGGSSWGYPWPALMGGRWYNLGCGTCGDDCSCTHLEQIELPYPVAEVTEVKIDGQVIVTGGYRVDGWRYLVLLNGDTFPECNDLNLDDDQEGTWSVTANYGEQVPQLGLFAVNELALQIALACVGGGNGCVLPSGVVTKLTRQGVTKDLTNGSWLAGFTALPAVSAFLETFNPTRSGTASVFNIDSPAGRGRIVGT